MRDSQLEHVTGAGEHLKKEDYLSPTKSPTFKKGRMKEGKELEASVAATVPHLQNNVYAQEQETVFLPPTRIFSQPIPPPRKQKIQTSDGSCKQVYLRLLDSVVPPEVN